MRPRAPKHLLGQRTKYILTIREALRNACSSNHDRLDGSMASLDLNRTDDYRAFLQIQLAARRPIERWMADNCPSPIIPPAQSHLIEEDLRQLGASAGQTSDMAPFSPPAVANPLGASWAIAGSHLGNRAMLSGMTDDAEKPTRFLSDPAMIAFWKQLRPALSQEAGSDDISNMVQAADAVFETFLAATGASGQRIAA